MFEALAYKVGETNLDTSAYIHPPIIRHTVILLNISFLQVKEVLRRRHTIIHLTVPMTQGVPVNLFWGQSPTIKAVLHIE